MHIDEAKKLIAERDKLARLIDEFKGTGDVKPVILVGARAGASQAPAKVELQGDIAESVRSTVLSAWSGRKAELDGQLARLGLSVGPAKPATEPAAPAKSGSAPKAAPAGESNVQPA